MTRGKHVGQFIGDVVYMEMSRVLHTVGWVAGWVVGLLAYSMAGWIDGEMNGL